MEITEFILFLFGIFLIFYLIIVAGKSLANVVDLFLVHKVQTSLRWSRWFFNREYRRYRKSGGREL